MRGLLLAHCDLTIVTCVTDERSKFAGFNHYGEDIVTLAIVIPTRVPAILVVIVKVKLPDDRSIHLFEKVSIRSLSDIGWPGRRERLTARRGIRRTVHKRMTGGASLIGT